MKSQIRRWVMVCLVVLVTGCGQMAELAHRAGAADAARDIRGR